MPIFGRRQLQHMLDGLGPLLTTAKAKDLIKRIEHKDPDKALPGEYELAISWAVSQVADLEIDRPLNKRTPDIYSPDLLPGGPAFADVAALSDDSLSGESVMRRAANIIGNTASSILKGAANHLYYVFAEERGFEASRSNKLAQRYYRRRRITKTFRMDDELQAALHGWLKNGPPTCGFAWASAEIDVAISWRAYVHPLSNTHSSMPSEAHDLRDNPLYRVLKEKERQLRSPPAGVRRAIFLGDAGCSLLRDLRPIGQSLSTVSGYDIIRTFLADTAIDLVVVLAPRQTDQYSPFAFNNPPLWQLTAFDRRSSVPEGDIAKLIALRNLLPPPYLHGYQARSWHQQRMFEPQGQGHYLPAHWSGGLGKMTIKISARGLQELIAGRMTREEFVRKITGERDPFAAQLAMGKTISNIHFESKGIDDDDDHIVFEFSHDPAAAPLLAPQGMKGGE